MTMSSSITARLVESLSTRSSSSIILPVLVLVAYLGCTIIYRLYFHPLAAYPGPLLGKITRLYALSISLDRTRSFKQYELIKKYGSPLRITPNGLLFADAKAWTDIYGQSSNPCPKAPFFYDSFTVTGATNVLNAVNKVQHARIRRLISHSFSMKGVLDSEDILRSKVEMYVKNTFSDCKPGQSVEIYQKNHQHYFDIISQLSFGRPCNSLTNQTATSYHDVDHFIDVVPISSLFPFLRKLPLKFIRDGYQGVARLESFSRQSIRNFVEDLEKKDLDSSEGRFLRGLITATDVETGNKLSMDELVENAMIFLVAGSGTTAVTTTYFIWELGRRPRIQKKLVEEIRTAFPDPNTSPSYEEACKLVRHP